MPKKRQPKSLLTKPLSTPPISLSSARSRCGPNENLSSPSVNERIERLRVSQPSHDRPIARAPITTASIPPSLRTLLDFPETAPPQPRAGTRSHGLARIRRIPGPPPPRSWLTHSKHASKSRLPDVRLNSRLQQESIRLPEARLPSESSLQHILMKKMAMSWRWHAEFDGGYLQELPLGLRETLLSYVAMYSEDEEFNAIQVLFPDPEEADEVKRLDLSNALGRWLTMNGLLRSLVSRQATIKGSTTYSQTKTSGTNSVPDSWDEPAQQETIIQNPKLGSRFRSLQHLSLALDPTLSFTSESVSWARLLALAPHIGTLSSLSLAYWPTPTYTPIAASTRVTIENPLSKSPIPVVYGGTNMYSSIDNDWTEAKGLLRTLSRSLYCLTWLDLTGCAWLPALKSGPDWNGSWRGIKWLGLGIGWRPIEDGTVSDSVLWANQRRTAEEVAGAIKKRRLEAKRQMIVFDYADEEGGK